MEFCDFTSGVSTEQMWSSFRFFTSEFLLLHIVKRVITPPSSRSHLSARLLRFGQSSGQQSHLSQLSHDQSTMKTFVDPKWISVRWRVVAALLAAAALFSSGGGCSLGIMAGKAIFGDPKQVSEFRTRTGIDLTKEEKKLLVVVRTPQAISGELPSLDVDLINGISRRLKLHGVKIINPDDVAKWIDKNGGRFDHPSELAREFHADFIAVIDVDTFSLHDHGSPTLYHGLASGQMQVFKVQEVAGTKEAHEVFAGNFRNQYPPHGPVPADSLSSKMFEMRFIDNLSDRLGSRFYDYRRGDEM